MKNAWKTLCDNEEQYKEMRASLLDGKKAFFYLSLLIKKRLESTEAAQIRDAYDIENWALRQADMNGRQRTYKEILELLKVE